MAPRPSRIDPRLAAALAVQFEQWRAALRGAERVGWKLGIGDGERIGDEVAIGHLTSATLLDPDATYAAGAPADLRADAEVALRIGQPVVNGRVQASAAAWGPRRPGGGRGAAAGGHGRAARGG